MNKLLLITALSLSANTFASPKLSEMLPGMPDMENFDIKFDANGQPMLQAGVHVLPHDKLPRLKVSDAELQAEYMKQQTIKAKGFKECNSCKDISEYWDNALNDLHDFPDLIKKDLSSVSLSFPYHGLPSVEEKDIIATIGVSSVANNTFGGVMQIFYTIDLGICSFTIEDATHSGSYLDEDEVNYSINKKLTHNFNVVGNHNKGFVYTLDWYDASYNMSLTCLNYKFTPAIKKDITEYARKIDSAISQG